MQMWNKSGFTTRTGWARAGLTNAHFGLRMIANNTRIAPMMMPVRVNGQVIRVMHSRTDGIRLCMDYAIGTRPLPHGGQS